MRHIAYPVAVALAITAAPSIAQHKLAEADARYINQLATMNVAEIEVARVATTRARRADVKHFAREILVQHGEELDELQNFAARKGVPLPTVPDARHQAALKRFESMAAERFDQAYVDQMVKDHEQADRLSQRVARRAQDPDLKALARKTSARLKEHLNSARRIASSLKAAPEGGADSSSGASAPESGPGR